MERATGIGGVFLRSRDPEALGAWYRSRLGVGGEGWEPWRQEAGPTVFAGFAADTEYFPTGQGAMLNFRVRDMVAMLAQLRALGEAVEEGEASGFGRFARLHDPEGRAVELWEPPGDGS